MSMRQGLYGGASSEPITEDQTFCASAEAQHEGGLVSRMTASI